MKSHHARISSASNSASKLRKWLLVAAIMLLTVPLTALEKALGAEFHVNSTRDGEDAAPANGFCETATIGQCTLRAAIQEANALAGNDIIDFAIPTSDPGFDPGTGRHTINLTKALPIITTDMEITGPGPNKLTVRRNTGGTYPVFRVSMPDLGGVVSISGLTISRGYFSYGGGISSGGIKGMLNVTNCTVSGNSALQGGGGIYSLGNSNVTNSTISGNFAQSGGGIYSTFGTVNIINSTVTGNSASFSAGGIISTPTTPNSPTAILNITNSTISGNSAPRFGGVSNTTDRADDIGTVKSSIIALNTATQNPDLGGTGSYISQGFNLIGDADGVTGPGFNQPTDQIGTSAAPLDAKLDPNGLQDNGGPIQTIALLFGSPAIDKGTSNGLTGNLTTDQRGSGFARTFDDPAKPNVTGGDGTDIGAFEGQGASTTPGLSSLGNISTRSVVQTGDNVLIGGILVVGANPRRVIVRAIGPSLNIAGKLADPTLELRDGNGGLIRSNDNWRTGDQEADIIATTIPPTNDLESAIVATLPANNASYTAIVRGVDTTTGIAVVEVYALQ